MASAILQFRINDGAPQSLSVIDTPAVLAEAKITLLASSYVGWGQPPAVWVIAEYPDGFACPTGWTTHAATGSYRYTADPQTGTTPPDFYLPDLADITAGQWGKFEFRLIVKGTIYSVKLGIEILSPAGLHDLAAGEETEFGGTQRAWVGPHKDNLRVLNDLLNSGGASALGAYLEDTATALNANGVPIRLMTSALSFKRTAAQASALVEVLRVGRIVSDNSGHATTGTGGYVSIELPTASGTPTEIGRWTHEWTAGIGGSVKATFSTYRTGALTAALIINDNGRLQIGAYSTGRLKSDSSGNITSTAIAEDEVRTALALASASIAVNSQKITGLADGVSSTDAATYGQLLAIAQGLSIKASVRAATTADITLSGNQTIDGVALVDDDEALVKNQSTGSQSGIYVVKSGAWTRRTDLAAGASAAGVFVFVEEGTVNADSGWVCTTNAPSDVVGTDSLAFAQFSGAGQITAGNGLTKTGNTINAVANGDGSIVCNADDIQLGTLGFSRVQTAIAAASADMSTNGHGFTSCPGMTHTSTITLESSLNGTGVYLHATDNNGGITCEAGGPVYLRSNSSNVVGFLTGGSFRLTIVNATSTFANEVLAPTFSAPPVTGTDAASVTFDMSTSQNQHLPLDRATTAITMSNARVGGKYRVLVFQDAFGNRDTTWTNTISWCGLSSNPDLTGVHFTLWEFYCWSSGKFIAISRSADAIP